MLSNFAITIGIPVQDMLSFMEENAHDVSVNKSKRTGDTFLTVRHWMRATTEIPHGKKSRRTCKCGDSRQTFGRQWKRDYNTYPEILKNQRSQHYLSKYPLIQSGITYGQPFKNKTQSNGRTYSRDACPTSGRNSPLHTSVQKKLDLRAQ
jgi:hypothetical protein